MTVSGVSDNESLTSTTSPVTGEIVEVNDALPDAPETVNQDPHGEGWMIKVKLEDPSEVDSLMSSDDYDEFITEA